MRTRIHSKKTRMLGGSERLEERRMLAAEVRISEVMAANELTLEDGFNLTPDWIEIENVGDEIAQLGEFHLSDDVDNLNKWTFPTGTTLGVNEFLVVFASGLDRVDPAGSLHTSFRLAATGGYIALSNARLEIVSDFDASAGFREQFTDVSFGISHASQRVGYLATPSPGAPNADSVVNAGPELRAVTRNIGPISDSADLIITASVTDKDAPTRDVTLTYRTMYAAEMDLRMTDDGRSGDAVAGDGTYSATVPASAYADTDMIRWSVAATDNLGNRSRAPAFLDREGDDQSPEYYGTIVSNSPLDTKLPVYQWYIAPGMENAAGTRNGARASVYYAGEFYDNVFVRVRGNSSAGLAKKSFKFDFNTGHDFRFDAAHGRVPEINLNTTYPNKDYIRQALAFEVYDQAGVPGSEAFPIRVQRNGEFFSVAILVEQPDAEMLRREGMDPNGALYKMYSRLDTAAGAEKRTRDYESNADLSELARQVTNLEGEELRNFIFDNINIPQVLNYLAATVIMQNNDQMAKNYFVYRDSDGSGEWSILPWDLDLTFGLHFMSNDSILDDEIFADKDDFTTFANATIWPSHPFVGDEAHPANRSWNRLIDALYKVPEIREMHLRRLRTLMDEMLQPPETPESELKFETRLDEYVDLIRSDVALDYAAWANPWGYGADLSLDQAIQRMKELYFRVRREHLYETHSVNNLDPEPPTVVLPEFATASYFVPSDDSLGTRWTATDFDDTNWGMGETGIGFEDAPSNFIDDQRTLVRPTDTVADGTSIFMRVPFNVADLADFEHLTLRMKYDDGFVAYLNGTEIMQVNLRESGPQSYNSRARSHSTTLATTYESFDLSQQVNLLTAGKNILAIHGMNSSATNGDMLFLPVLLEGKIVTTDIAGIPNAQSKDAVLSFGETFDFNPASGNQDEEYFTLRNASGSAIEISGWTIEGSAYTTFAPGTVVPANGELYVSPSVAAFRARSAGPSGNQGLFVQRYNGHLANAGDTLRLRDDTGRLVTEFTYVGTAGSGQSSLRVSEISYNPYPALPQFGELATDNDSFEFIEITNTGDQPVHLAGVQLVEVTVAGDTQGVSFAFPATTLAAGERTVVAKNVAAFASRYGAVVAPVGEFTGKLSNGGETLTLLDTNADIIQQFRYNDTSEWPQTADGGGASLVAVDVNGDFNAGTNWRSSDEFGGTPGQAATSFARSVVVNEVASRTVAPVVDRIELFNTTNAVIDVSGWYISDSSDFFKFAIPAGTTIAPAGFLVFDEVTLGFGFKGDASDDAWLVEPDPTGRPRRIVDYVTLEVTEPGQSNGRVPDGNGAMAVLATASLGSSNGTVRRGDFDSDGQVNAVDIDLLCQAIRAEDDSFDLTGDRRATSDDLDELVENILGTHVGDANLDRVFDSRDLVLIFQAAQYEDSLVGNSTWQTGDWNCDGDFTTADLVLAFVKSAYVE